MTFVQVQKAPDGSESSRWIRIQTVALFYPKCANSQNMKSQRSISNELQYKAKHDFILISKKICNDIFVIQIFLCDKRMATPQKCLFFSGLQRIGQVFFWPFQHCLAFYLNFYLTNRIEKTAVHSIVKMGDHAMLCCVKGYLIIVEYSNQGK